MDILLTPLTMALPIVSLALIGKLYIDWIANEFIISCVNGINLINISFSLGFPAMIFGKITIRSRLEILGIYVVTIATTIMYFTGYIIPITSHYGIMYILSYLIFICMIIRTSKKFHLDSYDNHIDGKPVDGLVAVLCTISGTAIILLAASYIIPLVHLLASESKIAVSFIGFTLLSHILCIPTIIPILLSTLKGKNEVSIRAAIYTSACNVLLVYGIQFAINQKINISKQLYMSEMSGMLIISLIGAFLSKNNNVSRKGSITLFLIYLIFICGNIAARI
jgi:Ca2+/Na+ antiporter